jgi:sugar lactone lactonase YvrE
LNDVAAAPDGRVYVSDSGMKLRGDNPDPTGTDAVWVIDQGQAKPVAKTPALHQPNGIAWASSGLVVVALGAAEAYRLDAKGAMVDETKLVLGGLDGVVVLPGDVLLVVSGDAHAIYKGKLGGAFEIAIPGQSGAADIGYDTKRGRVLVPRMTDNTVEAYDFK